MPHTNPTPQSADPILALFTKLLSVPAPSGYEAQIAAIVRAEVEALGYAHTTDSAGNVLVRVAGQQADAPLLFSLCKLDLKHANPGLRQDL